MPEEEINADKFGFEEVAEVVIFPAPAGAEEFPPIEEDEL